MLHMRKASSSTSTGRNMAVAMESRRAYTHHERVFDKFPRQPYFKKRKIKNSR